MNTSHHKTLAIEPVKIGFLHPGEMGTALAEVAKSNGALTYWASAGRSPGNVRRAQAAGIHDLFTLQALCDSCDIIVSICPPHAALDIAVAVKACGFSATYVDANAIAPSTAEKVADVVEARGATYVDAAVVGPPPNGKQLTTVYFSGNEARKVIGCFAAQSVEVRWLGPSRSQASALKMCHSAMSKGQLALLLSTIAAAEHYGVRSHLENLWGSRSSTRPLLEEMSESARRSRKGWRFAGEMQEVAATLASAGLPTSIHQGASTVFQRCPSPETDPQLITISALIQQLLFPEAYDSRQNESKN